MIIDGKYECTFCGKEVNVSDYFSELSLSFLFNGSDYNHDKVNLCQGCSEDILKFLISKRKIMEDINND